MVSASLAQQNKYNNASAYSTLGFGIPVDYRSAQAAGMGITGVSISNRFDGNISNPALWSNTFFTLANGGLSFNNYESRDQFGETSNTHFAINHFQLQMPILRDRLGVSLSLHPITENRFSTGNVFEEPNPVAGDTLVYESFFRGDGGLNRLELGFGYAVNSYISVGYAASLVFGVNNTQNSVAFLNTGYAPINYEDRTSSVGLGNRFGVYAQTFELFSQEDAISFGATVSLPVRLSSIRESSAVVGNQTIDQTPVDNRRNTNMLVPMEFAAGATYYANRYVMISAEATMQNWSNFLNFNGQNEDFLKDRLKLGAGVEYGAFRRPEENLFTRFNYRAGFSFDSGHLSLNGSDIRTVLFSFGLGIPSPASGSSVDIMFDYGMRGTTSHELVRERIFALRMSFNLSERMFFQRRLQ